MRRHPFLEGLKPTLHIAHRGGAALAPENTLGAFEQAVTNFHTDILELDVQPCRDGTLIVAHDPTVERCSNGTGAIADLTLEELRALDAGYRFTRDSGQTFPFRGQGVRYVTFDELLTAFPTTRLNVELKSAPPGAIERFVASIKKARAVERVCCGSELDEIADPLYRALPEGCHFYPRNALALLIFALRSNDDQTPPLDPRFSVLDMPVSYEGVRLIDETLIDTAAGLEKWINVWTIDDETEMRQLAKEGVGGIMTDRPDILRRVLDGKL
ncbi:MAG: glycerophosphodiester phosphodiesterase [Myxococcaceae bacterium]